MKELATTDGIAQRICWIRGHKVMLDRDLAQIYGVSTKRLNEQVRRNLRRFPDDFMFRLTKQEADSLRSQTATLKAGRGRHRKYLPYAFTEHGAVMLSSVLNSSVAIEASIQIARAFVQLRGLLASHKILARRLDELEAKYDKQFKEVFDALRELMEPPREPRKGIGFRA